ncbi:PilN domain-containing protein [candidate division KSB1 bacterium]|nr:PilN domain-containing protein [candidate division KSB1 bacterium]
MIGFLKRILGKQKNLSFGLDWGTHSVKLIGLRMLESKYELTHILFFELPVFSSAKNLTKMIQHRLKKINFYGAKITVGLPSDGVKMHPTNKSILRKILNYARKKKQLEDNLDNQKYNLDVTEEFVKSEWSPRKALKGFPKRLEIDNLTIPLLQNTSKEEYYLFLNIGYKKSQLIFSLGQNILEIKTLKFSFKSIIPKNINQQTRKRIFDALKSDQISYENKNWIYKEDAFIVGFGNILIDIQGNLKELENELKELLLILKNQYNVQIFQIKILGGGGLYNWLKEYISQNMNLQIQNVNPFTQLSMGKAKNNFDHLHDIKPIFSQAIALAMAGAQSKQRKRLNLIRSIPENTSTDKSVMRGVRLIGLSTAFTLLFIFVLTTYNYNQKLHEFSRLSVQKKEIESNLSSFRKLNNYNLLLTNKQKKEIPRTTFRKLSSILTLVSEQIPRGIWVTDIKIVTKENSKRKSKRKKEPVSIVIEGKSVSGNYVTEFFNKLSATGYFSQLLLKKIDEDHNTSDLISYKLIANIRESNVKVSTKS